MAWNVGVRALDFTGISGHSAGAMTVWPVLAWMLAYKRGRRGRIIGLCFGLLLALAIALSRIVLHAHSVAEVVGGVIMGLVMISIFLFHEASLRLPRCKACLLLPLFMVVMVMHGRSFPSEWLLQQLALQLSSDGTTYTRHFRR
jgi:membrane-associated phospholipid phosphatase